LDELDESLKDPELKPEVRERLEKVKDIQQKLRDLDKQKEELEISISGKLSAV